MSYELKDYLNSINHTKENLLDSDDEMWEKYPAYVVNHCLGFFDTIMFVNEMNLNCHLDAKLQNDFLINTIKSKKDWIIG